MMFRCIKAEISKLRRSMIWLAVILLPFVSVVLGAFNYIQNIGILTQAWYSLWTQVCLFYNYLFFPVVIAAVCAYICRLEYMGNNWNTVLSQPVPIRDIYFAKIVSAACASFTIQFLLGTFYVIVGKMFGLSAWPPVTFLFWLFRGWIASLALIALQMLLSLCIQSFALPIGIALIGGVSGIISLSIDIGLLNPYALLSIGMHAADPVLHQPFAVILQVCFSALLFFALFFAAGMRLLQKRDVKN